MKPRKNTLIKLEDIVYGKGYAFTVNPAEQYFGDTERFKKVIRLIRSKLSSPAYEYKLYCELSPSGRIHGHGYIWIYKPLDFVMFDIPYIDRFMNIEIDIINDEEIWEDYIHKQIHITKTIISRFLPVISDNYIKTEINEYYDI